MTTNDAPTGNDPPKKRLTVTSKINDYRPKLFATLTSEGVIAWDKYNKRPRLIRREECELFWAKHADPAPDAPGDEKQPDVAV